MAERANLTLRQRLRLQRRDAAAPADVNSASRKRIFRNLAVVLVVLLLAGGIWAWLYFHRSPDPRLQEIIALQTKISKLDSPFGSEAFAIRRQIEEKMKGLSDDSTRAARDNAGQLFKARLDRFWSLSSQDQLAELDQVIAGIQAMEAARSMLGGNGNNNGNGGQPGGRSDLQRAEGLQKMISTHPPLERGQFGLGRQMMNARMQQQGIAPH
jgi:hypothetical protein